MASPESHPHCRYEAYGLANEGQSPGKLEAALRDSLLCDNLKSPLDL